MLKHFGVKSIPGLGTAIGIVWIAWESYETYKMVENMTLDEFTCVTGDFIVDYGAGAFQFINGLITTAQEAISNPSHSDLVENEDGWEFTTPAIPVPVRVPNGTVFADSTADNKSITFVPGRIDITEYPEQPLELPLREPSWVQTEFPVEESPFDKLVGYIDPLDDIDIDIPSTRVQVDAGYFTNPTNNINTDTRNAPGLRLDIGLGTGRQNRDEPWKLRS